MAGDLGEVAGKDRAADRVELDLADTAHAQPDEGEVEAANAGKQRHEPDPVGTAVWGGGAHVPHTPWQSLPNPSASAAATSLGGRSIWSRGRREWCRKALPRSAALWMAAGWP